MSEQAKGAVSRRGVLTGGAAAVAVAAVPADVKILAEIRDIPAARPKI